MYLAHIIFEMLDANNYRFTYAIDQEYLDYFFIPKITVESIMERRDSFYPVFNEISFIWGSPYQALQRIKYNVPAHILQPHRYRYKQEFIAKKSAYIDSRREDHIFMLRWEINRGLQKYKYHQIEQLEYVSYNTSNISDYTYIFFLPKPQLLEK